jgi:8-oxo-dGTP diphosphatase
MGTGDPTKIQPSQILAAGGILERRSSAGIQIAIVHRRRYRDVGGKPGDHVLPKGKLRHGETLEQAALREVEEETGGRGRIVGPAFRSEYAVGGVPKVVQFFPMSLVEQSPLRDTSEVLEVHWLTPGEALHRLTYETERAVLHQAYPHLKALRDAT